MKKRILSIICASLLVLMTAGCGSQTSASKSSSAASEPDSSAPAASSESSSGASDAATNGKQYTIGISQFAQHGSLDNCREGLLKGLADEGFVEGKNLTVLYENSEADTGTAGQIASDFVSKNVDMICTIATPSTSAAYAAAMKTNIPIIYTAITDPVAAGFAKDDGMPTGNLTGTSDKLPVEEQLKMIRKIMPNAKKLGIMYTTSETNSESAIKDYQSLVGKYGFELVTVGINTTADIPLAADNILSKVDCLTNLTDNTVVQGLATIVNKANAKGIPVFGSEVEQVKNGCLAAVGLEFVSLGEQTGHMAAKVLKGEEKASDMKFQTISKCGLYINKAVADKLNIKIDDDYAASAVQTFDSVAQQ
ncbi:MAG: ABC transporter substrate-binding protein [Clostridia bacterium]|jgi:putative ABC transport system substrate-binding protein|nr:ABC transporter substrate-binding protein [Clostridia bacterium]MCI1999332.1 ABC transporter substrate-binding protein [Clostridia bacterium]MCI2015166.1 ABC transporter substrate-binding protein [Clostridia bacterium]